MSTTTQSKKFSATLHPLVVLYKNIPSLRESITLSSLIKCPTFNFDLVKYGNNIIPMGDSEIVYTALMADKTLTLVQLKSVIEWIQFPCGECGDSDYSCIKWWMADSPHVWDLVKESLELYFSLPTGSLVRSPHSESSQLMIDLKGPNWVDISKREDLPFELVKYVFTQNQEKSFAPLDINKISLRGPLDWNFLDEHFHQAKWNITHIAKHPDLPIDFVVKHRYKLGGVMAEVTRNKHIKLHDILHNLDMGWYPGLLLKRLSDPDYADYVPGFEYPQKYRNMLIEAINRVNHLSNIEIINIFSVEDISKNKQRFQRFVNMLSNQNLIRTGLRHLFANELSSICINGQILFDEYELRCRHDIMELLKNDVSSFTANPSYLAQACLNDRLDLAFVEANIDTYKWDVQAIVNHRWNPQHKTFHLYDQVDWDFFLVFTNDLLYDMKEERWKSIESRRARRKNLHAKLLSHHSNLLAGKRLWCMDSKLFQANIQSLVLPESYGWVLLALFQMSDFRDDISNEYDTKRQDIFTIYKWFQTHKPDHMIVSRYQDLITKILPKAMDILVENSNNSSFTDGIYDFLLNNQIITWNRVIPFPFFICLFKMWRWLREDNDIDFQVLNPLIETNKRNIANLIANVTWWTRILQHPNRDLGILSKLANIPPIAQILQNIFNEPGTHSTWSVSDFLQHPDLPWPSEITNCAFENDMIVYNLQRGINQSNLFITGLFGQSFNSGVLNIVIEKATGMNIHRRAILAYPKAEEENQNPEEIEMKI
jgi:hypothetical protein